MRRVVLSTLLGAILAATVVWLGLLTATEHPRPILVVLFGIAAALLGPIAASLLGTIFNYKRDDKLTKLLTIADIEQKVADAQTVEQKLAALKDERKQLALLVRVEARRLMLQERKNDLLAQVKEMVRRADAELSAIEIESRRLGEDIETSAIREEIAALLERLRRMRDGDGRKSTKWLDNINLPYARGPMVRSSVDSLLDLVEWLLDWPVRRAARKSRLTEDSGSQELPGTQGDSA